MSDALDPKTPVSVPYCCEECQYWAEEADEALDEIEGEI